MRILRYKCLQTRLAAFLMSELQTFPKLNTTPPALYTTPLTHLFAPPPTLQLQEKFVKVSCNIRCHTFVVKLKLKLKLKILFKHVERFHKI